jgi:glycosyltransferase involved in cell wall biosynthesis
MKIAVIVAVRNEEDSIGILLDGLLRQIRAPDEIVITDNGSTDATAAIIHGYVERGAPIRLLSAGAGLPGRGRNLAAKAASSEWLAFIDAGIRPEGDWLEKMASRAVEAKADIVYGGWQPVTDTLFTECAAIAYLPAPSSTAEGTLRPRSIASALMRRQAWEDAGGFPEQLRSAEDLLFMDQVDKQNLLTARTAQAMVYWTIQRNLWTTFIRFVIYARNNIRAGLWRRWQATIFLRYALLGLTALPAIVLGSRWLIVPVVLWLVLLTARGTSALWKNRRTFPAGVARNILRLVVLVPIIATLDAAAFAGSIAWLFLDKFGLARAQN